MLRVVIDTSTLISFALTSGEITSQIIRAWQAEEFVLLTTTAMRNELRRVLDRPRIRARAEAPLTWIADELEHHSWHVPGQMTIMGACRDPKDDVFLACAIEGQADYLASSDRDLLDMHHYQDICIVNPGQFLVGLQLSRLTVEQIVARFSPAALEAVQSTLCLNRDTAMKVAQARQR